MGIHAGDHVDLSVASIALGGLQVAVVQLQLIGGTGMAQGVKDHFWKPCFLPQLLKRLQDDTVLTGAAIGQCHHQIVVLILVAEQRPQLVLRGFPFPQDVSQGLGQPHLADAGIGLGLLYEELVERCDAVAAASIRTRESLRDTEQRITNLALLGKQIDTYRKLKPVYDRYKASKDKEKFLRGFESEIILFEAAAREIKKAGLIKLPSAEKFKAELDGLAARKTALQRELRKVQREEKEYDMIHQNIDTLLETPKELNIPKHVLLE